MIPALVRFVESLRAEGHAVSPAEVVDASRALDAVGLERRTDARLALRATLAKDREAAEAFDRHFDRFFASPPRTSKGEGRGRAGSTSDRPRPGSGERGGPKRTKPKVEAKPRRREGRETKASADVMSRIFDDARHPGKRERVRLRRAILRPAARNEIDPVKRDLSRRLSTEQERDVAREVPRVVHELKLRVSRRGAAARSGRPWLRRALRDNLEHGGVPFVIPHRSPKRKGSRVVLLVDVSFSVARAAGLFLLMAARFVELGRRARVLAFVDRPVDATTAILRWARGQDHGRARKDPGRPSARRGVRPGDGIESRGVSFADVLSGLSGLNLDAPSDYGTAFHSLRAPSLRPRGRDTILVVLGDGRTNRFDPLPWALEDVARGCRAVLWLVPEPRLRWGTADSALPAYVALVDLVVEANDLDGLARGLGALVRRL